MYTVLNISLSTNYSVALVKYWSWMGLLLRMRKFLVESRRERHWIGAQWGQTPYFMSTSTLQETQRWYLTTCFWHRESPLQRLFSKTPVFFLSNIMICSLVGQFFSLRKSNGGLLAQIKILLFECLWINSWRLMTRVECVLLTFCISHLSKVLTPYFGCMLRQNKLSREIAHLGRR